MDIDDDPLTEFNFRFVISPNETNALKLLSLCRYNEFKVPNTQIEVCPDAFPIMKDISLRVKHAGIGLVFDYGKYGTYNHSLRVVFC